MPPELQQWFTAGLLVVMFVILALGRWGPDIVIMGTLGLLLLAGVADPSEAFDGFASRGIMTVAFLYVVAAGMKETNAMHLITARLLGRPRTLVETQARLTLPVAALSAFINNTPIVAMFLPVLDGVAKRVGVSPSKLFIPLSYATILGGVCTLIGTSTNVIVAGLVNEEGVPGPDGEPIQFSMFTIAPVGLPIAAVGLVYILVLSRRMLPDRITPVAETAGAARKYTTALRVTDGAAIQDRTVEQAGLRRLPGLFLSRIERDDRTIVAVSPEAIIRAGDVLVFVGAVESVKDLQQIRGLVPVAEEEDVSLYRPNLRLVEAVVSPGSPLVAQTIRGAGIRTRYGAVVVGVHRHGHRVQGKLGDVRLQAGDTLLLEAPQGFVRRWEDSSDFYLVTERADAATPRHERAWVALLVLVGLIGTITLGILSPVVAAAGAAGAMILFRCCTGPQARTAIDWQILVVIGAALGLGRTLDSTGLARAIADTLLTTAPGYGPWFLLGLVYVITLFFTACMTNNAAAVLMFPITLQLAQAGDLNFMPFAVAITVAASCEFSTPIGYQTNLMVMGPGGYKWIDYFRFGGPLTLICGTICVALAPLLYGPF